MSDVPDDFMANVDKVIEEDKDFLKVIGSGKPTSSILVIPRCPNCNLTTPGNAQLLSLLITIPLMIWMVFWLKKMIDTGGKDPKKFWSDEKDDF